MKKFVYLTVVLVSILANFEAEAAKPVTRQVQTGSVELALDQYGMPHCVLDPQSDKWVQFVWTADSYQRRVYARAYTKRYQTKPSTDRRRRGGYRADLYTENCVTGRRVYISDEPESSALAPTNKSSNMVLVRGNTTDVFGVALPDEARSKWTMVSRGANLPLPDTVSSPADFLAQYKVDNFSYELNKRLTFAYGIGFAGGIYRGYLERIPSNKLFRQQLLKNASEISEGGGREKLGAFFQNRVVVLVKGLAHESQNSAGLKSIPEGLRALGVEVAEAETTGLGSMLDNALVVHKLVLEQLKAGKRVTILTLSKGAVESYLALSKLQNDGTLAKVPGKIDSMVNFGAIFGHSYFLEKFTGFPEWLVVKGKLKAFFSDIEHYDFKGLKELADSGLMGKLRDQMINNLPQDIAYLTFTAIPPLNGIAVDDWGKEVQDDYIRPHLKGARFGANDIYIEFPFTTLDQGKAPMVYNMVIEGTHGSMLEGTFEPLELSNLEHRKVFSAAVFAALADKLGESAAAAVPLR